MNGSPRFRRDFSRLRLSYSPNYKTGYRKAENFSRKDLKRHRRSSSNERALSWRGNASNSRAPLTPLENFTNKDSRQSNDRIKHLRIFNNWAKGYIMLKGIVSENSKQPIVGLDLGCSKGSELKKWHHCNVKHLYLVENDPAAIQECRYRYLSLRKKWPNFYRATFIKENMWAEKLSIPTAVDMVSSQMSLHKAFESRSTAENLAKNISDSLKCGGTFVASLTCSSKIIEGLRNCSNLSSFGNSVFQIKLLKPLPEKVPEFGFKFQFEVGNHSFEEYLIQEFVLEQVMAKYGLVLIKRMTFLDLYLTARRNPEEMESMFKMGIIRGSREKNSKKVYLTMSDGERQAAALFESVVFRKTP